MLTTKQLEAHDLFQYAAHLKQLNDRDRYLRFGLIVTDEQIDQYIDTQFRSCQTVLAVFDGDAIVAAVELVFENSKFTSNNKVAELGISVLYDYRKQGIGSGLFRDAAYIAQNQGVTSLVCHHLSENPTIQNMASKYSMPVNVDPESKSSFRYLSDLIGKNMAVCDYTFGSAIRLVNHGYLMSFR